MAIDILEAWMQQLVDYVRSGWPDLTNRQLALLMLVYRTDGPHTVRGTAAALRVTKPVVTRALNTLAGLDLIRRERDNVDRRSVFIRQTHAGNDFLDGLAHPRIAVAGRVRHRP